MKKTSFGFRSFWSAPSSSKISLIQNTGGALDLYFVRMISQDWIRSTQRFIAYRIRIQSAAGMSHAQVLA